MSVDPKNQRRALGRGLDALLPAPITTTPSGASYGDKSVFFCPIERLGPQPGQPRQHFDDEALEELTASIREHGLIEPLVVRRTQPGTDRYEIIAGERRWRAAQRAGLKDVLVVVKDVSPKDAFELALVENVQREDLNPIELAEAYERLLKEHGYSPESLAERVGKNRSTVANSLRLLKLPPRIRSMVISGDLTEGHARAILGAPSDDAMSDIADKAVRGRLPVRKVEELVRTARSPKDAASKDKGKDGATKSPGIKDLEARLMRKLGTKVEVRDREGRGELVVSYASLDELDRILAAIGA
ncbi:MAG: ParB/RepB/Spo0J family partition protein [Polyangiaceae bacterium]|nr:ParB/RepB/Spo0J family partition protein [Polyangiaceae bacterium]